jgi:hypothetical protein
MNAIVSRLGRADVLVVGGSVHAAAVGLESARAGFDTVLCMRSTSPIVEIGSSMGATLSAHEAAALPEPFRRALLSGADEVRDDAGRDWYLLNQTRALVAVEDLLLDAGVRLFYGAHPVGVLVADGHDSRVCGALVGGKFGAGALIAPVVVDATANLDLVRRAGHAVFTSSGRPNQHSAWFLTDADRWAAPTEYTHGMSVAMRGPLAEFRFSATSGSPDLDIRRAVIAEHASWCGQHADAGFSFERAGDELLVDPGTRIKAGGIADSRQTGLDGLYAIGPAADLGATESFLDERTRYAGRAPDLLELFAGRSSAGAWRDAPAGAQAPPSTVASREPALSGVRLLGPASGESADLDGAVIHLTEPDYDEPGVDRIEIEIPAVRLAARTDLVIVGGGTSGAQAAQTAG